MSSQIYDFAIIGAGVSGAFIAFELSKYSIKTVVLEKENDLCMGASKANSAIIHAGYDPKPGTLKARLNVRGNELIREYAQDMDIPCSVCGSLVLAFDDDGLVQLRKLYERGQKNGVPGLEILSAEDVLLREPNITKDVKGALFAPTGGIVSPFDLCEAPLEIAVDNGCEFIRNFELCGAVTSGDAVILKSTNGTEIKAHYVINAAGVHADSVAALFGDDSFKIKARRGEYSILDKTLAGLVKEVIFQPPTDKGKGVIVTPTVGGNILVGPSAEYIDDKDDTATTADVISAVFRMARLSVPSVSEKDTITSFSGNRPSSDSTDFIIGVSEADRRLINVAGIDSPGLTSSPAIGEYVAELIKEFFPLEKKNKYSTSRKVNRVCRMSSEQWSALIKKEPLYGKIICRCESITEGEIVAAINKKTGARDIDGVKRRTRAGMGRCQSGFCSPKVIEILSRELDIPKEDVTKCGGDSFMLSGSEKKA